MNWVEINIPYRGLFRYDSEQLSPDNYPHVVEKFCGHTWAWYSCPSIGTAHRIRIELNTPDIKDTGVYSVPVGLGKKEPNA